jgi:hypothetical protein
VVRYGHKNAHGMEKNGSVALFLCRFFVGWDIEGLVPVSISMYASKAFFLAI